MVIRIFMAKQWNGTLFQIVVFYIYPCVMGSRLGLIVGSVVWQAH